MRARLALSLLTAGAAVAACSSGSGGTTTGQTVHHTAAASGSSASSGAGSSGTTGSLSSTATGGSGATGSGTSGTGTSGSGSGSGGLACNAGCPPTYHCISGACIQCLDDTWCGDAGLGSYCVTDGGLDVCDQCRGSADCPGGESCEPNGQADPTHTVCISQNCNIQNICGGMEPLCEPDSGVCINCLDTAQCSGSYVCVPPGLCQPCGDSAECAAGYPNLPYCGPEQSCVECLNSTECPDGGTCTTSFKCIAG